MRFIPFCVIWLLLQSAAFGNLELGQENRLGTLENAVQQVLKENAALRAKLYQLEADLSTQEQQKGRLMETVTRLEHVVEEKQHEIDALGEELAEIEEDVNSGTNVKATLLSNRKRQLNSAWVGFTAVISPADVTNLHPGQPIIFDKVITNMGSSYNASSGKFTAPVKGYYVFNMAVLVEPGENEYLQFVKDGNHVMYNYAHARGSLHDVSSSRTVVLELSKGNQVWVQTAPNSHHGSGTIHGNGFTTFSGFLQAMVEDGAVIVGK